MDLQNPAPFRVFAVSGDDRQRTSADRAGREPHRTPNGVLFELIWINPGYKYQSATFDAIDREVAKATVALVGLRVAHGYRERAIKSARKCGVPIVQLRGAGTGATGVLRAASEAIDAIIAKDAA